jgi:two-component system sensor histidine kinase DegS
MVSEVSRKQDDLRNLTRSLISVQEDERKKIAADIHDTLTQMLTAIGYKALLCQELMENNTPRFKYEFTLLIDNINDALSQSRQIISNLRPKILDDIGILAAFRKVISDFQQETNFKINFICPGELLVSPNIGISLYRILQESLYNIAKHAHPSKVDIHLTLIEGEGLFLVVEDDGVGFDPSQHSNGLGLMTMRERAEGLGGEGRVYSSPGKGCRVEINIPLKEGEINAISH